MKRNESGRTILEMLGVIVTVAVLLMASMTGYNFLVQKQRRNEAVKQVVQLVTALRVSGAARKYAYRNQIPVQDIIKDPRTDSVGKGLKLADSEKSYAVLHALKNGDFILTLQAEKSTCDEILAALRGYSKGSEGTEKDEKGNLVTKRTETGSFGVIVDKSGSSAGVVKKEMNKVSGDDQVKLINAGEELAGSNATLKRISVFERISCESVGGTDPTPVTIVPCPHYLCNGECRECPCDQEMDAHQKCCAKSEMCEGLCECPRGYIKKKVGETCQCVECNGGTEEDKPDGEADAECRNRAQALGLTGSSWWSVHSCNRKENKCVECVESDDCQRKDHNPFYAKYGNEEGAKRAERLSCVENHCVECTDSYAGAAFVGDISKCPENYPACVNGECIVCPKGKDGQPLYSEITGECGCPEGEILSVNKKECVKCYDSARLNKEDKGCENEEGRPMCSTDPGTKDFANGGSLKSGTGCYKCLDDIKTISGRGRDVGCSEKEPICVNGEETWVDEGNYAAGTTCVQCVSDEDCNGTNNEICCLNPDGCGEHKPHTCYAPCKDGKFLDENGDCRACQDNMSLDATDRGCPTDDGGLRNLCVPGSTEGSGPSSWTSTNNGNGEYGETCALCQDDQVRSEKKDSGCSDKTPLCGAAEDGMYANNCYVCQNNEAGGTADYGCGSGTWDKKPLCGTKVTDGYANTCYVCQDTAYQTGSGEKGIDLGCSTDEPICGKSDNADGTFGDACYSCADIDSTKPVWNPDTNECVVCYDSTAGLGKDKGCDEENSNKPICVDGTVEWTQWKNDGSKTSGTKCVVCYDDKTGLNEDTGCGGTGTWAGKPICVDGSQWANAATGTVGKMCVRCADNQTSNENDIGCDDRSVPLCVGESGDKSNWTNDGNGAGGTQCVYCFDNQKDKGIDAGCVDADAPLCVGPDDQKDNWLNDGSNQEGKQCVFCYDDQEGSTTDAGCDSDYPICVYGDVESDWKNDKTRTVGTQCVQCVKHTDCAGRDGTPYCSDDNVCVSCTDQTKGEKPVWNPNTEECVYCYDENADGKVDDGCPGANESGHSDYKLCVPTDDQETTKDESKLNDGSGVSGEMCRKCHDNKTGANKDSGCDEDGKPICVVGGTFDKTVATNQYGTSCAVCYDDVYQNKKNTEADTGCGADKPICSDKTGSERYYKNKSETPSMETGTICYECLTHKHCKDPEKPMCNQDHECEACDGIWNPETEHCVKCYDTKTKADTDSECPQEKGSGNLCRPYDDGDTDEDESKTNKGEGAEGDGCYKCQNNNSNDDTDYGCTDDEPLCETQDWNAYAGNCRPCQDNTLQVIENGNITADYGCGDGGEWTEEIKPVCGKSDEGKGTFGDICVQCVRDEQCPSGRPKCDPTDNTCKTCAQINPAYPLWDGGACRACLDDKSEAGHDENCGSTSWANKFLCKPLSSNGNGTGEHGMECYKCQNNNSDENTDYGCTDDEPFCGAENLSEYANKCYVCQNNKEDGTTDYGCTDDEPLCETKKTNGYADNCRICQDSAVQVMQDGNITVDYGCGGEGKWKGKPVCGESDEGKGAFGDICVQCVRDEHCPSNTPKCDPRDNTCKTCVQINAAYPLWDGSVCRACLDDKSEAGHDENCGSTSWANKFLCKPLSGNGNGTGEYGDRCYKCQNNNSDENMDYGCTTEEPLCDAENLAYGDTCHVCQNNKADNTTDDGCGGEGRWKDKLLCNTTTLGDFGTECKKCVNDKPSGQQDTGCPKESPNCNADDGKFGNSCEVCADTKTGATDDRGCGSGSEAGKPICGNGLGEKATNDGKGTLGKACVKCIDDKGYSANKTDSGCSDARPVCVNGERFSDLWRNEGSMIGGNNCVECVTNNYCTRKHGDKKPICNQNTYTCEACPSDKPFWNGEKCIACSGSNYCLDSLNRSGKGVNACIKVSDYVDIYRYSDGRCGCYKYLVSQYVSDEQSCNVDFDRTDKRKTSRRERIYRVPSSPANFYCTYKFTARGEADDYVSGSYPAGISSGGKNNTHDTWKEAHDNRILNPTSTGTIGPKKGDQAYLIVSDRWLQEVGYYGDFVFTLANAHGAPNINNEKTGLSVSKGWNSGSSQCSPLGDWRKKD